MRYAPYQNEYLAAQTMSDGERLDYFLTRVFETDEVWLLRNQHGWLQRELESRPSCLLWPYQRFAADAALDYWHDYSPSSMALDFFLDHLLDDLIAQNLMIDIMPRGIAAGCLITAQRLRSIFRGMIDAGEYRLDG